MHAPPELPTSILQRFLASEAAGGIVLMAVAALALIVANSPLQAIYFDALKAHVAGLSILHWINDGLMAVFFLLVGLEIKREILEGQLSSWARRALPGAAALGGMMVPALIYVAFNLRTPETLRGWAIPAATDIAFALGVLALLGSRVPVSLKIFLTALAILDDLGAVAIIAVFYTSGLDPVMLGAACGTILALAALNRAGVERLWPYVLLGVVLWFFVLKSGVHATLAGIALAIAVPLRLPNREAGARPLIRMEHALQPWVAFAVVPVFGFANAGVSFAGVDMATLLTPVPLGVAFGLLFGKQLGVSVFAWAAIKAGLAELPVNASARQFYGVAILCGIGFTMSLFIGLLAFPDSERLQDAVKIGVIAGSVLSAMIGAAVLARRT
ncbi:MAG: Na+/H+ antiporter NhaA [Bradyrhizobium sp.]